MDVRKIVLENGEEFSGLVGTDGSAGIIERVVRVVGVPGVVGPTVHPGLEYCRVELAEEEVVSACE